MPWAVVDGRVVVVVVILTVVGNSCPWSYQMVILMILLAVTLVYK